MAEGTGDMGNTSYIKGRTEGYLAGFKEGRKAAAERIAELEDLIIMADDECEVDTYLPVSMAIKWRKVCDE